MEKFIEQNHRNVADTFEEYKNVKPFKFLPGHVALIFGIKKQIEDFFHDNKKPKKGAKVDIIQNEDELQANLLHQLSVFTKNLKLDAVWTKNFKTQHSQPLKMLRFALVQSRAVCAVHHLLSDMTNTGRTAISTNTCETI